MPNLVHSLDAASLCLVINNYFKQIGANNKNFYSVHDCFAVPCNKVDIISELLKSAYVIIYSKRKYLVDFDTNFVNYIKHIYGEDSVEINEDKDEMTILTDSDSLTFKYIPIKRIISSSISNIDVNKSSYLIH